MDLKELSPEQISAFAYGAVKAVIEEGGFISIGIVSNIAEIQISKIPLEVGSRSDGVTVALTEKGAFNGEN